MTCSRGNLLRLLATWDAEELERAGVAQLEFEDRQLARALAGQANAIDPVQYIKDHADGMRPMTEDELRAKEKREAPGAVNVRQAPSP